MYETIFQQAPNGYAVLASDAPKFTILAVNDAYLLAVQRKQTEIIGKGLFEAFPESPNKENTKGIEKVFEALNAVLETKQTKKSPIMRYDIPTEDGKFIPKYWSPEHVPILGIDGTVLYILQSIMDITNLVDMGLAQNLLDGNHYS